MEKSNELTGKGIYHKDIKDLRDILRKSYQINSVAYYTFRTILSKGQRTHLKFIYPYMNMESYLERVKKSEDYEEQWEKIMIEPYWNSLKGLAGNLCCFFKPKAIKDINTIEEQSQYFRKIDLSAYESDFKKITRELPTGHSYPITVAFYPMDEYIVSEGIHGYCCPNTGNILIRIDPTIDNYYEWIPFVFAHEYHHSVLFFYWNNIKKGRETKGNLLEWMINEGQADEFAKSLFPGYEPSWHKGVSIENEKKVWQILKNKLYDYMSDEEMAKYILGSGEYEIPHCAGYYFGSKIVRGFMKKYPNMSFKEMIKIPHETIFNEGHKGW